MIELQQINHHKNSQILDDLTQKGQKNVLRLLNHNENEPKRLRQKVLTNQKLYIHPTSNFCILYNILYLITFYTMQAHLTLTMTFGFYFLSSDLSNELFLAYYWSMVGFFVIDILVTVNKGYYNEGKGIFVDDYVKMFKRYANFQLWIDIVCAIFMILPYLTIPEKGQLMMFIPVLLSWIKKFKIQHELIHSIQYHKIKRTALTLVVLACDFLMIGHYGACLFLKIDMILKETNYYGDNKKYIWFETNDPFKFTQYDGRWYLYYLYAQIFATGTLSTIAPGPYPKNPISVIFSIFYMLFCIMFTSYMAEVLIEILEYNKQKRTFYEDSIEIFARFLRASKITLKLQIQVYNYFEVLKEFDAQNENNGENVGFTLLPQSIKRQLSIEMSFLNRLRVFKSFNHHENFIYQLSKGVKKKILTGGTDFFQQTQLRETSIQTEKHFMKCESIYFLVSGTLKYLLRIPKNKENNEQIILGLSNVDKFIGLYEFITNQAIKYGCKTIDLCQINIIERKSFENAIKLTKNEEKFHQQKNQVLIENRIQLINKVCAICLSEFHIQSQCSQIVISKQFQDILSKYSQNMNYLQRDHTFIRNSKFKIKSSKNYIKKDRQKNYLIKNSHNHDLQNTKKLHSMKEKAARIQDFESCKDWKNYYPQFNLK